MGVGKFLGWGGTKYGPLSWWGWWADRPGPEFMFVWCSGLNGVFFLFGKVAQLPSPLPTAATALWNIGFFTESRKSLLNTGQTFS